VSIINDLTDHQLSLLRAVLDGVIKFSASDVIEKYRLNSSANVRRVKDALKKKEVLTFNEKDEPVILDPLFEYWVSNIYFDSYKIENGVETLKVKVNSRMNQYETDENGLVISGYRSRIVNKNEVLTFERDHNKLHKSDIVKCPNCLATLSA
jgi:hypothetical protein